MRSMLVFVALLLAGCAAPGTPGGPSSGPETDPWQPLHATACQRAETRITFPVQVWEGTQPEGFALVTTGPGSSLVDFALITRHCDQLSRNGRDVGPLDETWGFIPVRSPDAAAGSSEWLAIGGMVETENLQGMYEALGLSRDWLKGTSSLQVATDVAGEKVTARAQGANETFETSALVGAAKAQETEVQRTLWFMTLDKRIVGRGNETRTIASIRPGDAATTTYEGPNAGPLPNAPPIMAGTLELAEEAILLDLRPVPT